MENIEIDNKNEEVIYLTENGSIKYALLPIETYDLFVSKQLPSTAIKFINPGNNEVSYDEYEEIKKQVLEALDKTFKPKPEKLN